MGGVGVVVFFSFLLFVFFKITGINTASFLLFGCSNSVVFMLLSWITMLLLAYLMPVTSPTESHSLLFSATVYAQHTPN